MFKLIILFTILWVIQAKEIPDYLNICSFKDKDFSKCAVASANKAFPSIVKGDKRFLIPSLNPFRINEITIDSGANGIKIYIKNVTVYGLNNLIFHDFRVFPDQKQIMFSYYSKRIEIIGHYNANGKLLILPIVGEGKCNITGVGGNYTYFYNYKLIRKGNEFYALPNKSDFQMKMKRSYFYFENLIGGDIGSQVDKFLNDNWEAVLEDLGSGFTRPIAAIAESIVVGYFKKIPFKVLIPGI